MVVIINNYKIKIDAEDMSIVYSYNWKSSKNPVGQIYFVHSKKYLHRAIMNCPKSMVVDHINGNTLDNRKSNLRICSKKENQYNQKKHKGNRHSKFKGVTFRKELKQKPWEAFIYKDYKSKRLGYFATEQEAALAYNKAANKAYGEFAKLNEIKL
jgi:hypothetical protein